MFLPADWGSLRTGPCPLPLSQALKSCFLGLRQMSTESPVSSWELPWCGLVSWTPLPVLYIWASSGTRAVLSLMTAHSRVCSGD